MKILRAGKLEVVYENGFLRYFKVNHTEVLRMIYFAIRDVNWGNYAPIFYDEKIEEKNDSFKVRYNVKYSDSEHVFFKWEVEINGLATNEIHFDIKGEALRSFGTNRAGFCVLHPIEHIAGESVEITHAQGEKTTYSFPQFIAPHQPFIDISAMKWKIENNEYNLHFEGDIFETEDQRNWGDASYKTYCTPLYLPFPKQLNGEDKVNQKVVFKANIKQNTEGKTKKHKAKIQSFKLGICESIETDLI
jgi:hypothetical protein